MSGEIAVYIFLGFLALLFPGSIIISLIVQIIFMIIDAFAGTHLGCDFLGWNHKIDEEHHGLCKRCGRMVGRCTSGALMEIVVRNGEWMLKDEADRKQREIDYANLK